MQHVQEAVIKTILKKKKCKKAKWLSEEDLQIAEKIREEKGKGEKEIYIHLHAEFQITRRDRKAFLSDQCKEREQNHRMGKTRDLVKKIRVTKGTYHAKMGRTRTETVWTYQKQKIIKSGGKNTRKNYTKKILMTQITTMV